MDSIRKSVKRFGLQYCDLSTMIGNVSFFLRAVVLNIEDQHKKSTISIVVNAVFAVFFFYVYIFSILWYVFVRSHDSNEYTSVFLVFSLGVSSQIGPSKYLFMQLNEKKIRDIVKAYRHFDKQVTPGSRVSINVQKVLRHVKRRAMIFWIVIIGNGFLYGTKPLILPGRVLIEEDQILYGLEPMIESPNYEIAYILTLFAIVVTVYLPSNISALFIVLSGYNEAQMLALSEELTALWTDAEAVYNTNTIEIDYNNLMDQKSRIMNEHINKQLKFIITNHSVQRNLLQDVEKSYRGATVIEFVLLTIGIISELLGGLENTYILMPFCLMMVGMDCLMGQRVSDASVTFERAAYFCKWENFDVTNMRMVLVLLQNSQQTMKLSAGGVAILNFECMMMVITRIYSCYTTLRSTVQN